MIKRLRVSLLSGPLPDINPRQIVYAHMPLSPSSMVHFITRESILLSRVFAIVWASVRSSVCLSHS